LPQQQATQRETDKDIYFHASMKKKGGCGKVQFPESTTIILTRRIQKISLSTLTHWTFDLVQKPAWPRPLVSV